MCHYDVVAKDTLPEVVSTYLAAFVCNTHESDQPGEHWVAMYVDELGDYLDPYGQKPQHTEFTNFMNKHCSKWSPNYHILQSPISTVCGQYCVAFLKCYYRPTASLQLNNKRNTKNNITVI